MTVATAAPMSRRSFLGTIGAVAATLLWHSPFNLRPAWAVGDCQYGECNRGRWNCSLGNMLSDRTCRGALGCRYVQGPWRGTGDSICHADSPSFNCSCSHRVSFHPKGYDYHYSECCACNNRRCACATCAGVDPR
jgi:hypothetical protein